METIYSKLTKARVSLQNVELKKSGFNKHANFHYFELKDFINDINRIFSEIGLCGVVSFTKELAELTIYDTSSDGVIKFTSPMPEIKTSTGKGEMNTNQIIQSIGAVETYQRRYLYMAALEIAENDIIDAQDNTPKQPNNPSPKHESQTNLKPPAPQNTSSPADKKSPAETFKERFAGCKTKEEMAEMYNKLYAWVSEKHPDLSDELDLIYNDALLNLI